MVLDVTEQNIASLTFQYFFGSTENTLSEDDSSVMIAWLKGNRQPEAKVRDYMLATAPKRIAMLKEANDLGSVLLEYPRLLDTPGMVSNIHNA